MRDYYRHKESETTENMNRSFYKRNVITDYIVIAVYLILSTAVMLFHEPWYDEAQSWQIARCASLRDIIFKVPHLEGHPPVWHLILSIFAKNGIPYELGLRLVVTFFSAISITIFIRKSPFSKTIRYVVPFTYFFFYQYRVLSRPYCIMILAFCLLGIFYEKRNEKKLPFVAALGVLCCTSAYGIVMAFVICIFWMIEIWKEKDGKLSKVLHDRRFLGMALVGVLCLFFVISFIPAPNSQIMPNATKKIGRRFFALLFLIPSDVFFTSFDGGNYFLTYRLYDGVTLFSQLFSAAFLLIPLGCMLYRCRKLTEWVVMHVTFCFFAACVYIYVHHIGIMYMYTGYMLWTGYYSTFRNIKLPSIKQVRILSWNLLKSAWFCVILGISVFWSVMASIQDVQKNYGSGKELAQYVKENDLKENSIMIFWEKNQPSRVGIYTVSLLPYLDVNPFINFGGEMSEEYRTPVCSTNKEREKYYAEWRKRGEPAVLLGGARLKSVYGEKALKMKYQYDAAIHCGFIWKGEYFVRDYSMYKRRDE